MIYVLILLVTGSGSNITTGTTAEFADQGACAFAGRTAQEAFAPAKVAYLCSPKSLAKPAQ